MNCKVSSCRSSLRSIFNTVDAILFSTETVSSRVSCITNLPGYPGRLPMVERVRIRRKYQRWCDNMCLLGNAGILSCFQLRASMTNGKSLLLCMQYSQRVSSSLVNFQAVCKALLQVSAPLPMEVVSPSPSKWSINAASRG